MANKVPVLIKLLREGISLPVYMTAQAAGMDIAAAIKTEVSILPEEIVIVPTGIAIALPAGYEAQIRPRSGLAAKYGITMVNAPGTIDADYRGEIKIPLINLGKEKYVIKPGDRIAQMIVAPVVRVEWKLVDELPPSERAAGGFRHTGR
jgi:dUTP pyrophosphatase